MRVAPVAVVVIIGVDAFEKIDLRAVKGATKLGAIALADGPAGEVEGDIGSKLGGTEGDAIGRQRHLGAAFGAADAHDIARGAGGLRGVHRAALAEAMAATGAHVGKRSGAGAKGAHLGAAEVIGVALVKAGRKAELGKLGAMVFAGSELPGVLAVAVIPMDLGHGARSLSA